jgi:UDP-N-acetylmuramate dehydrogenase
MIAEPMVNHGSPSRCNETRRLIMAFTTGFEHIVRDNEPLAPYTWFRLGGAAEYFAEPTSVSELADLVRRCREESVAVRVLGGGSNLLVRDEGVSGLVIMLSAPPFGEIDVQSPTIVAGGGAKLGHAISTAVREGLAGLEALAGIPGSVGGALRCNADARGSDIGQWTKSAKVMTRAGEVLERTKEDLRFSYRQSNLDELVILSAEFELEPRDARQLTKRMQKQWIVQKASQPQGNQNLGCIFKDVGGVSATELIEQAGLRSAQVGEAIVSEHNANFIVANPGASTADVVDLIDLLKSGVKERVGVELQEQLEIW